MATRATRPPLPFSYLSPFSVEHNHNDSASTHCRLPHSLVVLGNPVISVQGRPSHVAFPNPMSISRHSISSFILRSAAVTSSSLADSATTVVALDSVSLPLIPLSVNIAWPPSTSPYLSLVLYSPEHPPRQPRRTASGRCCQPALALPLHSSMA